MQLLSNRVKFSFCTAGLILLLLSATPLTAEDRATTGSAKSLAAAETAFAQESVEKGMRHAFLQVLSDDSIVFLNGPQNGKKACLKGSRQTLEFASPFRKFTRQDRVPPEVRSDHSLGTATPLAQDANGATLTMEPSPTTFKMHRDLCLSPRNELLPARPRRTNLTLMRLAK